MCSFYPARLNYLCCIFFPVRSTQREKFQKWLDIAPSNILTVTNCFLVGYKLLWQNYIRSPKPARDNKIQYPARTFTLRAFPNQVFYQKCMSLARNVSFFPFLPAKKTNRHLASQENKLSHFASVNSTCAQAPPGLTPGN